MALASPCGSATDSQQVSPHEGGIESPLAAEVLPGQYGSKAWSEAHPNLSDSSGCAKLKVVIHSASAHGEWEGEVIIENTCDLEIAFLRSPIKVMVGGDEFAREPSLGDTDVFSRFVVLKKGESLKSAVASRTPGLIRDGAAEVLGPPRHATVGPQGLARFPLRGHSKRFENLEPGEYCAVLLAYSVSLKAAFPWIASSLGPIEIGRSVSFHNREVGGNHYVLRPEAKLLTAECSFFVLQEEESSEQ